MATVSHYDAQTMIDIFGSTQGRDLGGVAKDIDTIVNRNRSHLPRGSQMFVRGQIDTMRVRSSACWPDWDLRFC